MTSFHFWYIFRLLVSNYVLIILQSTQRRSQAHKWCEKFVKNSQAHGTNLLAWHNECYMVNGCDVTSTSLMFIHIWKHQNTIWIQLLYAWELKSNTENADSESYGQWNLSSITQYDTYRLIFSISSRIRFKFLIMFLHFQATKLSFPAPINLIESSTVLLKNCGAPPNMHGLLRLAAVCRPAPFSVEWLEYTNVPLHSFNICVSVFVVVSVSSGNICVI